MSARSKLENGLDWVKESHFRWARHEDAAECYWRTATEQVRALVEGLHAEVVELEARFQAGLDREKLMESEIERLRRAD